MSTSILCKAHTDLLVTATQRYAPEQYPDPDATGRKLWAANLAATIARWPDDADGERPGPIGFRDADVDAYTYQAVPGDIPPVAVLKALMCYRSMTQPLAAGAQEVCDDLDTLATAQLPAHLQQLAPHHLHGYGHMPYELYDVTRDYFLTHYRIDLIPADAPQGAR
jgi:hypothetical protein